MVRWQREHGDETVALVAHFLCTPFPMVRRTPIRILERYVAQATQIARLKAGRM
jgi:hypothetical protein